MKKKIASLTFDDGPHEVYTPLILDILKAHRVRATFFLVGKRSKKYPELVKRIHREGHDIGNHTYSHPVSPLLRKHRKAFIREEIERTNKVIHGIIGRRPLFFRSTLAFWDISVRELLKQARACGHVPVGWTFSTKDWLGVAGISRKAFLNNGRCNKDIVLLHDGAEKTVIKNRRATVEILPELIEHYRKKSYRLLTLTEML